ncbi:MAG: hypothetical protein ACE5EN_05280, partial [Nitrospinota bacterium]
MTQGVGKMLRLALKRNGFFVFFILFVAVIASACGEESSSSVPTASTANCAAYSYTSSSTVSVSPSAGYAYGGIAVPPATITFNDTTVAPAKVTITSGFPPFGVSAQSFASMSLAYAGPYAFGTGFLSITAADAVASTSDPSCMTYVFWVVPEPGAVPAGTYSDMITVTDSKG